MKKGNKISRCAAFRMMRKLWDLNTIIVLLCLKKMEWKVMTADGGGMKKVWV